MLTKPNAKDPISERIKTFKTATAPVVNRITELQSKEDSNFRVEVSDGDGTGCSYIEIFRINEALKFPDINVVFHAYSNLITVNEFTDPASDNGCCFLPTPIETIYEKKIGKFFSSSTINLKKISTNTILGHIERTLKKKGLIHHTNG